MITARQRPFTRKDDSLHFRKSMERFFLICKIWKSGSISCWLGQSPVGASPFLKSLVPWSYTPRSHEVKGYPVRSWGHNIHHNEQRGNIGTKENVQQNDNRGSARFAACCHKHGCLREDMPPQRQATQKYANGWEDGVVARVALSSWKKSYIYHRARKTENQLSRCFIRIRNPEAKANPTQNLTVFFVTLRDCDGLYVAYSTAFPSTYMWFQFSFISWVFLSLSLSL